LVKADGVVVEREIIENDKSNEENCYGKHIALVEFFRFIVTAIFADENTQISNDEMACSRESGIGEAKSSEKDFVDAND